jgi:hypothetical protein
MHPCSKNLCRLTILIRRKELHREAPYLPIVVVAQSMEVAETLRSIGSGYTSPVDCQNAAKEAKPSSDDFDALPAATSRPRAF